MKRHNIFSAILALGVTICTANLTWATTLTLFGPGSSTTTSDLPPGPPDPAFTNSFLFDFNDVSRGIFGPQGSPNPLPRAAYKESELTFVLAMDGGFGPSGRVDPIVASQTFQFFIQGSFWSILGKLEFDPSNTIFAPNDVLTFSGDVVHRVAPHAGEFAPGDAIPFRIELNGGKSLSVNRPLPSGVTPPTLASDLRAGVDGNAKNHPGGNHDDVIFGAFIGQVKPNLVFNDFQSYQGELDGFHTPEPSTWMLFVVGFAVLIGLRRKILNTKTF